MTSDSGTQNSVKNEFRICHAFPFFSIRHFGGTSDWMYKLAKAQARFGMSPEILTGTYKFDQELAATIPNVKFRVLRSYLDRAGFSIMPGLFKFLRQNIRSYDVVHMHVFRTFQNAVLYHYCRKSGVPYIVDAHGAVPYHVRKPVIKRLFDRFIGRRMLQDAAAVIAETVVGIDEYKAISPTLDDRRIVVLAAPFDTEEFDQLPEKGQFRPRFGIPADAKLIMFLGRVHPLKGNDFLIEGVAELLKQRDDVMLAIVGGDDGHLETCQALAAELGISSKVVFTGFLGGKDKNAALVDADIVAQMSRAEQGAWAPIEAVLCGTPIIVSAHTGAGEDIRRLNAGYTAEFGNAKDFAKQANGMLQNYDDALKKTHAAADHIRAKHSMNARIQEFAELYARCVSKKPTAH